MRWDNLFHDLETQLDAEKQAADRDRDRDRQRQRFASMTLAERMVQLCRQSEAFVCHVRGHELELQVENHGKDWFAAEIVWPLARQGFAIIPFGAVDRVVIKPGFEIDCGEDEIPARDADDRPQRLSLIDRISFRIVLRDLARRRRPVRIVTGDGELAGTIDRVGQDFVDLARHSELTSRRGSTLTSVDAISLGCVSFVLVDAP